MDAWSNLDLELVGRILASLAVVLVLGVLRLLILRTVASRSSDVRVRYRWWKATAYIAVLLSVLFVGPIWLESVQTTATFLGLASAGLALALRDPLANLVGWIFIVWRRPFEVGDRIQIGEHAGDVVDLRIFQFTLLEIRDWVAADQSTGRVIHVPNGQVFVNPLVNYTSEFEYIWHEIPVNITFESDWQRAKAIIQEIADRHAGHLSQDAKDRVRRMGGRLMIVYSELTPIVYTRVVSNGVLLTARYLCDPRRRRSMEHAIWEDILQAFAEHPEVEFAYPTQRFYRRRDAEPGWTE
ncbi:MAG TPA: mechanosensitive ion channel [Chloroflexi bacterium]|nr:mechanosensitive ion channel [Chloroflexota bacterium]